MSALRQKGSPVCDLYPNFVARGFFQKTLRLMKIRKGYQRQIKLQKLLTADEMREKERKKNAMKD